MLCGMAFVVGCLYQKRLLMFSIQALHIAIGCILTAIQGKGMWLFPVSHSFLACHYQRYFRRYVFNPWLSIVILEVAWLLLAAAMYWRAQRVDLDMIGGEVLR